MKCDQGGAIAKKSQLRKSLFLSDFCLAVAVIIAKAPYCSLSSLWHSSGDFWCLLSCVDCENVLWHLSHLNGFSPVCVRIWLFSVVAPANERPQNPHLNGFSLMWMTTCSRSSAGPGNDEGQWPHWYGRSGDWKGKDGLQLWFRAGRKTSIFFQQI